MSSFIMFSKILVRNPNFIFKTTLLNPVVSCLISNDSSTSNRLSIETSTAKPRADPIITALKSASNLTEALKVIGIHASHMNKDHVTFSLRTLNDLGKYSRKDVSRVDVLNSEDFIFLFRRLKKQLYLLDGHDLLQALKTVTLFKVPFNSTITMKLLHLIKNEINNLSLSQLIFLSFLLRQHPSSSVVDALKMAIPIVFENQVKTKLDRTHVASVVEALIFCSKNKCSQDTKDYIVSALYDLDQLDWVTMDPKKAHSIAIALSDLAVVSPVYEAVFKDASEVFANNIRQFSFSETDLIVSSIVKGVKGAKYLNHPPLFDQTNNVDFQKWTMQECSLFLRKLNLLGFVNIKLLDVIAEKILDDPESFREGRFNLIKTFVTGLSIANYRTDHWNLLKDLIPAATVLENIQPKEPWIPLCLDLAAIDIFSDHLISQVFSPWFLETYLAREYNKLDLLQLLRLYQIVSVFRTSYSGGWPPKKYIQEAQEINGSGLFLSPMLGALQSELGKNCVLSRCKTHLGHYIDHLVVVKPGGDLVEYPCSEDPESQVNIDDLNIPAECQKVAILFLSPVYYNSLKQLRGAVVQSLRTLEVLGYAVVSISADTWHELPDWEKCPYLHQQIKLSCSDLYHKQQSIVE